MRYAYPAVFTKEDRGYSVLFPDLEGCYTCGDDLKDAIYMAEDVLAFTLYDYEKNSRLIPPPRETGAYTLHPGEFINYIACDTDVYHRRDRSRSVKKTLSIPDWLNDAATVAGINFSQVLQEALAERLNIRLNG